MNRQTLKEIETLENELDKLFDDPELQFIREENQNLRGQIGSLSLKIAEKQRSSTASLSETVAADIKAVPAVETSTRTTSPQLKQMRPNYFISLPIKNENIKGSIKIFEEFYKKNDPRNASGLTGYQKAHLTVAVFHLEESEIGLVQEMMNEIKTDIFFENILSQPVSFKGLGNFNRKVIYVQPVGDLTGLNKLNKIVTEKLLEIIPKDHIIINESYSPHLTIFKPNRKVKGPKMSLFEPIEEMDFGSELFDRIELCSMMKPKRPDGSYSVEYEVIVEKEEEQIMVGESDSIFHIQRVLGEYELTDF